jgi:L-alanine-DL-glutamate epimerase-like enolase superfamily enzyme
VTRQPVIRGAKAELWRYKLEKPVGGSGVASVDVIVVDVEDTEGQTGIGFSYVLSGAGDGAARAARRILDGYVVDKRFQHPEALHRVVRASFGRTGKGPLYIGLAAVDLAVWDLYAKRLGIPLGVAMGGVPRQVRVYGSGGFTSGQDPEEAVAQARSYAGRGALAVKPRVDGSVSDRTLIAGVCGAVQSEIFVAVDANEKCSPAEASWLAGIARDHGLLFVEEPLPARDLAGHRSLARCTGAIIATGEHLQGLDEAAPFISEGLCRIIQPDLAMMGGMTECLRVTRLAEALGIEVAPHFLPNLFVHLAAVSPNVTWLEDFPLLEPLFANLKEFDANGKMTLRDLTGHGLTWASGARQDFRINEAS